MGPGLTAPKVVVVEQEQGNNFLSFSNLFLQLWAPSPCLAYQFIYENSYLDINNFCIKGFCEIVNLTL